MNDMRLVIFDVDGTLVDSQAEIMAAMVHAFAAEGLEAPARPDVLSIVGLSLPEAFARLCPEQPASRQAALVSAYKSAFNALRGPEGNNELSPLFDGARTALDTLYAQPDTLLAVATGKSRRGLDKMLMRHDLGGYFHSQQVADFHPSKPHPSMVLAALHETGVPAHRAVMIGDTSYDIEMGRAAGVRTIGVSWGYHDATSLHADAIADTFAQLPVLIDKLMDLSA